MCVCGSECLRVAHRKFTFPFISVSESLSRRKEENISSGRIARTRSLQIMMWMSSHLSFFFVFRLWHKSLRCDINWKREKFSFPTSLAKKFHIHTFARLLPSFKHNILVINIFLSTSSPVLLAPAAPTFASPNARIFLITIFLIFLTKSSVLLFLYKL